MYRIARVRVRETAVMSSLSGCRGLHLVNQAKSSSAVIATTIFTAKASHTQNMIFDHTLPLMQNLLRVEPSICRIIDATPPRGLSAAAEAMCSRIFSRIEGNPSHPLRRLFSERRRTARNQLSLRPPFARTKRYSESFIKFARV